MGSIAFSVQQKCDVLKKSKKIEDKCNNYKIAEYLFYYLGYIIVSCVISLKQIYMFVFGDEYKI